MIEYIKHGIDVHKTTDIVSVSKQSDGTLDIVVHNSSTDETKVLRGYDALIWAIGREANTQSLNMQNTGIQFKQDGFVKVDEWQETGISGIYALGDVCGVEMLTPVAINAGRKLADRVFAGIIDKCDYENIPSVIFSHPPAASVGLSEEDAIIKHGAENIDVHNSDFVNMYYSMLDDVEKKSVSEYKMICLKNGGRVLGVHMVGKASDEIMQVMIMSVHLGSRCSC